MGSVLDAWTDWLKECAFIMKDPPFTEKATGIKKQVDFFALAASHKSPRDDFQLQECGQRAASHITGRLLLI